MDHHVTYQVEDWFSCRPEMEWLLPIHWQEIANDKDKIKLNPWWEAYEEMARNGQLQIVTVRTDEKIVGYHWSIIRPHLHYRDSLTAYTDIYYLHPAYRKGMNGMKLFKFAEACWRKRGVQKAYTASKFKLDMSRIFERLGWHRAEACYTKFIGD